MFSRLHPPAREGPHLQGLSARGRRCVPPTHALTWGRRSPGPLDVITAPREASTTCLLQVRLLVWQGLQVNSICLWCQRGCDQGGLLLEFRGQSPMWRLRARRTAGLVLQLVNKSAVEDFLVAVALKNPPVKAGDVRDMSSVPGSGRSPGGENDNPLQYSCLENPMDRAWRAAVHGVTKSRT